MSGRQSNMRATNAYAGIAASNFVKAKANIQSYAEAFDFLIGHDTRELASHVHVRHAAYDRAVIEVVLYETPVVTYYPDETFTVTNGGFRTPTTKTRINQFTPDGYQFAHDKKRLCVIEPGWRAVPAEGIRFPVVQPTSDAAAICPNCQGATGVQREDRVWVCARCHHEFEREGT